MLNLTVENALAADEALVRILKTDLPIAASWPLSGIAISLEPHIKRFHEARFALFKELGTEVAEKPGTFAVKDPEAVKTLTARIEELSVQEITISDFSPLPVATFDDTKVAMENLVPLRKAGIIVGAAPAA